MLPLLLWLCSAACWVAAAALAARLPRPDRLALAGLCALFAASAVLSPSSYMTDHLWHYLDARAAARDPMFLLSTWDRPAFMLLYVGPAQIGIQAARLMSVGPAAIAVAATMLAARDLGMAPSWLAGVLLAAQLDFFGQASSTMTELLFAAGLAVAIWAYVAGRPWLAAAGIGALAVARPEGPLFAALFAAGLWVRFRRLGPCAAALAPFAAFLAAGALAFHDPLWYLHENAYRSATDGARLRLEAKQLWTSFFYTAVRDAQPGVLVALEVAGAIAVHLPARRPLRFLLAPVAVSWLLLTFLRIGEADWWRQSRYVVTVAPALALLAGAGLSWAREAFPVAAAPAVLLGAAASAATILLEQWRPPVAWGATAALAAFGLTFALALALWAMRRRLIIEASLAAMLLLPLAASPPGSFGRLVPTAAERLDLAAVRWLLARRPAPAAVGWDTPALPSACFAEVDRPCPLPLRVVSLAAARPGTLFVTQSADRAPEAPPGWRIVWTAQDGNVGGRWLRPRWEPAYAAIWEKE